MQGMTKQYKIAIGWRVQRRTHANFKIFRGKLQRFRRRKFEKSTPQTQKFGLKYFRAFWKAAHDTTKTRAVSTFDFLGCATPKARGRRFLRKIAAFSAQKIWKIDAKKAKIDCKKVCVAFLDARQDRTTRNCDWMTCATPNACDFQNSPQKFAAFPAPKI